ncbi:class I SAM-dependent methyltransferase [Bacteriovoracaceae bacterium]|nr:class I SAM-dependent methyltransferase [Bacteriovoracaceae bacterium]
MTNLHNCTELQIDSDTVKRYFEGEIGVTASSLSMMAHEHNLPPSSANYRLEKEKITIRDWLNEVPKCGRVLDIGCGAGTWLEIFAKRFKEVIGVEQSHLMLQAAREKTAEYPNVTIFESDSRHDLPKGPFNMIFLGGLCMYLSDQDTISLISSLKERLTKDGVIMLRESTVNHGYFLSQGEYQAIYRSLDLYRQLFKRAGFTHSKVKRNYGYTNLVTAEELVNLRRKRFPFLPYDSKTFDFATWYLLRGFSPISFWLLPRLFSGLNIHWPRLQNHFFKLIK